MTNTEPTTEPTYLDRVAEALPELSPRTAGALPSTRTFGMVEDALASDDIEVVKMELQHTRAHYQSLEYQLNAEDQNTELLLEAIGNGFIPEPESTEDAIRLAARFFHRAVLEAAYDTAHNTGFFVAVLGMSVQDALKQLYVGLDFEDPEREDAVEAAIDAILDRGE